MATQSPLTYPATSDIGYALWLRHFAAALPDYASHYGLMEEELAAVQSDALEFTSWLIRRVHRATQAIRQPGPAAGSRQEAEAAEAVTRLLLLRNAAALVQIIRAHHRYTLFDGVNLKLNLAPTLAAFGSLPPPRLRVTSCQTVGKSFSIVLRWKPYPKAVIDLQVCRDGHTWIALPLVPDDCHTDTHPQPPGPVQWCYRARYQRPDWPAGLWSLVATVNLCPLDTRFVLRQPGLANAQGSCFK